MSNKNKKINEQLKSKLVERLYEKWKYLDFITIDKIKNDLDCYMNENNYALDEDVFLMVERNIYKEVSNKIRNGDINLEIIMSEQFSYIPNLIGKKMNIKDKRLGEDGLLFALENYDGTDGFISYSTYVIMEFYKGNGNLLQKMVNKDSNIKIKKYKK